MKSVVRCALGAAGLAAVAAWAGPGPTLQPGATVTVKGCGTSCVINIKVTLVTNGTTTVCTFNNDELALVLVPKSATSVTWHVKDAAPLSNKTFRFVPQDPLAPKRTVGVLIADNSEPVDPDNPTGPQRAVWVDAPSSQPDDVIKTIPTPGAQRYFKAASYTAYIEWKALGDPGYTACAPMDPIIMNDGM